MLWQNDHVDESLGITAVLGKKKKIIHFKKDRAKAAIANPKFLMTSQKTRNEMQISGREFSSWDGLLFFR